MTDDTTLTAARAAPAKPTRRRRMMALSGALIVAAAAWGASRVLYPATIRSTDDAYVNGHVVSITPQTAGSVTAIFADNPDRVQAGQTLVEIDPNDARIALDAAQAELARTVRHVRGLFALEAQTAALVELRRTELDRAKADLRARQGIAAQGAVTEEEARHAGDAVKAAQAAYDAALQTHADALAQVRGTDVDHHPDVQAALARVRAASLALERTTIRSPVSGMVAQRSVQLGKRVAVGDRLMAVVPLDQLWVEANFKEVELDGMCPGQTAIVTADVYGSRATYHGTVVDIEAGSGAAFSLLPAQNATGNWIKVVQRVPVRILLDPHEIAKHPLRIGMSTEVEVDTRTCPSGKDLGRPLTVERTSLYEDEQRTADQRAASALADSTGAQR
ncbi:HlyD family efflux transporter periplasmic adaptor subunit [Paraburkholderia humisilvae]|uniref:Multidrug export protein EmrA n=1 Tax=Paraburkholderia humisilvae TaxID=627669 RepID=A0A6J5D3X7_9BURK|nr:HlyD family efflux transporter periplasmic adaptor subunit [Paraburkholderia humisilvae]CAB3748990.1 Multidrug export protein EmrA [Paraburkholderia humisilvae]